MLGESFLSRVSRRPINRSVGSVASGVFSAIRSLSVAVLVVFFKIALYPSKPFSRCEPCCGRIPTCGGGCGGRSRNKYTYTCNGNPWGCRRSGAYLVGFPSSPVCRSQAVAWQPTRWATRFPVLIRGFQLRRSVPTQNQYMPVVENLGMPIYNDEGAKEKIQTETRTYRRVPEGTSRPARCIERIQSRVSQDLANPLLHVQILRYRRCRSCYLE